MKRWWAWLFCTLLITACTKDPATVAEPQTLQHGRFSAVTVYAASSSIAPPLLMLANASTDHSAITALLTQAQHLNTSLFVVDVAALQQDLGHELSACINMGGDFDNLVRYLEAWQQTPGFIPAILVTTTTTAPAASALLTPLPKEIFAGELQLTTAPAMSTPTCVTSPTTVTPLALDKHFSERFTAAYKQIAAQLPALPALDAKVAALPLNELPANGDSDTFAILISGDGGWAGFDRELADALQKQGFSVIGWDSLRYFWQQRTPESLATDLDTVIAHYRQQWGKSHVVLLGFSQGANVLPFTLDKLSAESRQAVTKVALISPERHAQFEFHLGNWVSSGDEGLPIAPVLESYVDTWPVYCVYGEEDKNAVCPELTNHHVQVNGYDSGHHLNAAIDDIVALLTSS